MSADNFVGTEPNSIIRGHSARVNTSSVAIYNDPNWPRQLVLRARSPLLPASTQDQSGSSPNQDAETESHQSEVPSPYEVLDSSNVNPFASMPVELSPRLMALLMDQTRTILLRQVTDRNPQESVASIAAGQMMRMTVQNTALFFSMIAAAMRFFRTARNDITIPTMEMLVESRSIELLSQEMANLDTALTEANIVAIVACGYCGKVYPMRRGKLPRQSFMRQLQDLNIYGRMVIVEAHVLGLQKLLPMLGGLYNLKTSGLAQLMSFCDLFDCTRKLIPPAVPFIPHTQTFKQKHQGIVSTSVLSLPSPDLRMLGLGFLMVWDGAQSKEAAEFIIVVGQLADFTILMDNFLEGRHTLEDPVVLTDSRNHAQHQLMSLPSSRSLGLSGRSDIRTQYESARLACIAYSLLVVFPLPPTVGLFEKLVRGMRSEVLSLSDSQATFTVHERKLHFWTLTLAAILGTGLPERRFFLNELLGQAKLLHIADWPAVLELVKQFLWHPSTNNKDGHDLWTELESMQAGGE